MLQEFHSTINFDHRFSESFITLILNNRGPSSVNDFLSVLLLGWVHKPIACVLMALLHTIMDSLVSFMQATFIRGCNIFHGLISVTEVIDTMKRNRNGIIFKLDFEKAYDRVNSNFL